ncbi:MbtH family protein [uncultured Mycobacterium sp.]|uniref:MbtH family protein n=1 Tax=uncultured Mycobacterium sp. TaxID=171292 RepID=UPI0035CAD74B
MSIDPLDDENGSYLVLLNDEEQHALRPTVADFTAGWQVGYREANGAACLCDIDQDWTDIRPKNLRERLAQHRAFAR